MIVEDDEIIVKTVIKRKKLEELKKYMRNSGANFSELVNALLCQDYDTPELRATLCYKFGRLSKEFKSEMREKICQKFGSLEKFAKVLGINRSYMYTVFNNEKKKGSADLWKRIMLAIKEPIV